MQERIAEIARLKDLLHKQCGHFNAYIDVLNRQRYIIEQKIFEKVCIYTDIEERIVADIFSLQKVIVPLEMSEPDKDTVDLKAALNVLCEQSISLLEQNRALLLRCMNEVHSEIQSIQKNPYRFRHYEDGTSALLLDKKT